MGSINNIETAAPLMRMMFSEAPLERRTLFPVATGHNRNAAAKSRKSRS